MALSALAQRMEQVVRNYIEGCNNADAAAISACFCFDAVHYFPDWEPWRGAAFIGEAWARRIRERGMRWTVDQLLTDVERGATVLEWTLLFKDQDMLGRGVDWCVFDRSASCIQEVRPFSAAQIAGVTTFHGYLGFDYAGRGYPTLGHQRGA
jgi:hypothetical protein